MIKPRFAAGTMPHARASGGSSEPDQPEDSDLEVTGPAPITAQSASTDAVEIDRVVPASGNLGVCGQQFWLAGHPPRRPARDALVRHHHRPPRHRRGAPQDTALTDDHHPPRPTTHGRRPPRRSTPPARPAADRLVTGDEIHRTVNASGNVSVAGQFVNAGAQHAGRRVTLRIDADLVHVLVDGAPTGTSALALTPAQPARLQGARIARPPPQPRPPARTQSAQGETHVIG